MRRRCDCSERTGSQALHDKVRFIEGDLFESDIGEATVVTLYLLTRLNAGSSALSRGTDRFLL